MLRQQYPQLDQEGISIASYNLLPKTEHGDFINILRYYFIHIIIKHIPDIEFIARLEDHYRGIVIL